MKCLEYEVDVYVDCTCFLYHHKKAAVEDKAKTGFALEAEVNSDINVNFYYSY